MNVTVFISWPYEVESGYSKGKHLLYLMQDPEITGNRVSGTTGEVWGSVVSNKKCKSKDRKLSIDIANHCFILFGCLSQAVNSCLSRTSHDKTNRQVSKQTHFVIPIMLHYVFSHSPHSQRFPNQNVVCR